MPLPYVMVLHQAPTDGAATPGFHFHIQIHPPLRKPGLLKYLAGPEIGGGNFLNDTSPEEKAAELQRRVRRALQAREAQRRALTPRLLLEPILALHDRIRDAVVDACERQATRALAAVDAEEASDTIYRIDRVSEEILIDGLREVARDEPLVPRRRRDLPAEALVLPQGASEADCRWRILVDPIDGTRGLMYQKRSAWILTGVAPNRGAETRLRDIVLAVQTEIPLVKQHLSDQLWAVRGGGVASDVASIGLTGRDRADRAASVARRHDRARIRDRQPILSRRARRARRDRRRDRGRGARAAASRAKRRASRISICRPAGSSTS